MPLGDPWKNKCNKIIKGTQPSMIIYNTLFLSQDLIISSSLLQLKAKVGYYAFENMGVITHIV